MRNGESASYGCAAHVALRMSKSSIIIEGIMARPAIHPGEILAEELAEIAVTPSELARQLRVPANRITQIVHGRRAITGGTGPAAGPLVRPEGTFWLNLQSAYDIRIAEKITGAQIKRLPKRV